MEWITNASTRHNQKPEDGTIFTYKNPAFPNGGSPIVISIHKYVGCGDALFLSVKGLNISLEDLETEDLEEAIKKAKGIVSERVNRINIACKAFCDDETTLSFSRY